MVEFPKLQACPKCGKQPEWFTCWADADFASIALWLTCDCKQIQTVASTPKFLGYVGGLYASRAVRRMSDEWKKYCEEACKHE